jgi:hypothetical protein
MQDVQSLNVDTNRILVSFGISIIYTNIYANNPENINDVVRNVVIWKKSWLKNSHNLWPNNKKKELLFTTTLLSKTAI